MEEVFMEEVSTEEVSTEEVSTEEVCLDEAFMDEASMEAVSLEEAFMDEASMDEASMDRACMDQDSTVQGTTVAVQDRIGGMFCQIFNQKSQLKQLALNANQKSSLKLKEQLLKNLLVAGCSQCLLASAVASLINGNP